MTSELDTIKSVFTFLIGLMGDIITVLLAHPMLLIPIAAGLVGIGISIFRNARRA
jgi:hypothetical protein